MQHLKEFVLYSRTLNRIWVVHDILDDITLYNTTLPKSVSPLVEKSTILSG